MLQRGCNVIEECTQQLVEGAESVLELLGDQRWQRAMRVCQLPRIDRGQLTASAAAARAGLARRPDIARQRREMRNGQASKACERLQQLFGPHAAHRFRL